MFCQQTKPRAGAQTKLSGDEALVARMMFLNGKKVSGSDTTQSGITDELKKIGIKIIIGQGADLVPNNTDLVIYSPAITVYDPKLINTLEKRKIKSITYPEALHEISKDKYTIAVSGTHGKTTTTAMISKVMVDAGLNPTVIVGSILKDQNSNFIAGDSKYFIVEACEYRKSFLNIKPTVALITNIDNDHLDFYKDINDIQNAFVEFISQVEKDGHVITDIKNKTITPVLKGLKSNIIDSKKSLNNKLKLKVPGKHNRENASLVMALGNVLGIDSKKVIKSLKDFSGTWRRFEYKGKTKNGVLVYDDYAHHPTEIKATLQGAREFFGKKKIFIVFQPHLYSRTKLLLNDFATAFKGIDEVLVAPIYAAREKPDVSINSGILVKAIKNTKASSFNNFSDIENYLSKNLKKGSVLITIGAGDIYKIGENILSK